MKDRFEICILGGSDIIACQYLDILLKSTNGGFMLIFLDNID